MRHRRKNIVLGRKLGPRKALLRNLATNLVLNGKIKTSLGKAKALRPVVEKYITLSKKDDLFSRRRLARFFYEKEAVDKLVKEIGPKYKERKGGYTRIIKLNNRQGDNAPMAIIELV
ncbi:MAG TPA: 50S ribosomal protein L17 [Patescibacteria group bacterium]|nr:50S ribosomal protein L17 [Patescibacteria group bacterium]